MNTKHEIHLRVLANAKRVLRGYENGLFSSCKTGVSAYAKRVLHGYENGLFSSCKTGVLANAKRVCASETGVSANAKRVCVQVKMGVLADVIIEPPVERNMQRTPRRAPSSSTDKMLPIHFCLM